MSKRAVATVAVVALALLVGLCRLSRFPRLPIARVIDGDTIELGNGKHVRLVQIDTPEVYGGVECYGRAASATTQRLLRPGTRVLLLREPASDPVDRYGRLLRYVVRARDGLNVNLRLVARGCRCTVVLRG